MQEMKIGCVTCGSHKRHLITHIRSDTFEGKSKIYHLIKCKICGLGYIEPQPSWDSIKKLYADTRYYDEVGTNGFNEDGTIKFPSHKSRLYRYILDRIDLHLHSSKPRILDIGCGWGHFLKMVKDRGWEAWGVELSKASCDYIRNRLGISAFNGVLKETSFDTEYFDAVVMEDVLEHMSDPFETIIEVRRILHPNGLIIIKTPNAASLIIRLDLLYQNLIFNARPGKNIFLHHLFYFTKDSLRKSVENHGFKHLDTIFFQEPFRTKARGPLRNIVINSLGITSIFPSQRISLVLFAKKKR